jgi:hypothetical protein
MCDTALQPLSPWQSHSRTESSNREPGWTHCSSKQTEFPVRAIKDLRQPVAGKLGLLLQLAEFQTVY